MPALENSQDLTPAAGSGIGKAVAADLTARGDFVELMTQAALDGLKAVTRRWDAAAKQYVEEPDYRTRCAMFFGLLAHMEGEPVKRILVTKRDGTNVPDALTMLEASPALQRAAVSMLAKAEQRKGTRPAKYPRKAPAELTLDD